MFGEFPNNNRDIILYGFEGIYKRLLLCKVN